MTETLSRPSNSCVVIIPALNESRTIATIVEKIKSLAQSLAITEIVVVDDGSADDTGGVAAEAGASVVRLAVTLGAWGATQAGLRFASDAGYEYAVTLDADGQHRPEDIAPLLAPILSGNADVAIGSNIARGSRDRKLAWWLLRNLSAIRLSDITSGFRVYNAKAMQVLIGPRASYLHFQDVGVLLLLTAEDLAIAEVSVTMEIRKSGASKIYANWASVIRYMIVSCLLSISKRPVPRRRRIKTKGET